MAPRAFVLLALAFAVVLLITSEVAVAKEVTADTDSEIRGGGRGPYNKGGRLGGNNNGGGKGVHIIGGGSGRPKYVVGRPKYGGGRGCGYGCCGGKAYGGCKCCSTFAEATAYKKTQN